MDVFKEILNFSLVDFADVFLVALLLYSSYRLLRGTVAINIFIGIILISSASMLEPITSILKNK